MLRATARLRPTSQQSQHLAATIDQTSSPDETKGHSNQFGFFRSSSSGVSGVSASSGKKKTTNESSSPSSAPSAFATKYSLSDSRERREGMMTDTSGGESSQSNTKTGSTGPSTPSAPTAAPPIEISSNNSEWNQEAGSSIDSAMYFIRNKRGLSLFAISILILMVSLVSLSYQHQEEEYLSLSGFLRAEDNKIATTSNGKGKGTKIFKGHHSEQQTKKTKQQQQQLVAPIHGMAYLTPDEFRDIRTAHTGESVLITGGLGFIGSHVVDLLLHRGFKVTILDDESNGHNHNRFAKEMVPNDITVVGDLPKFPEGFGTSKNGNRGSKGNRRTIEDDAEDSYFTHVIHLAAAISVAESMKDPDKYERINYGGSHKVLDWIREYNQHVSSSMDTFVDGNDGNDNGQHPATLIRKVVAASSAAIYGDPDPALLPLQESAPYGGLSPYADTKFRMEGLMREFVSMQNEHNANAAQTPGEAGSVGSVPTASATALRFFNVYGPRQDPKNPYSGVISLFLEAALNERNITILGDGEMTRDFVYVKDVARAIVMALLQEKETGENGGAKNEKEGGNNDHDGKNDLDMDLSDGTFSVYNVCTGKSITINTLATLVKERMDSPSLITHLDPRDGDIRESSCNPNGAKQGMGFISAVSQETGLEKTSSWFRLERDSRMMLRNDGKEDANESNR